MFVELIELLRCPREHAESPLVAAALRTEDRHIVDGTLGCPVCGAEFEIRGGEALFDAASVPMSEAQAADPAAGMRIAALLDLADARGTAILSGACGTHAGAVRHLSDTPLLLVNPPRRAGQEVAAVIRSAEHLPLAAGAFRAAALDGREAAALRASIVRAVRPKGRIMGPATLDMPAGVSELARDATWWVGEKNAAPESPAPRLVSLRRA